MNENYYYPISKNLIQDHYLSDQEKLMLTVLSNLQKKDGYCWATNEYLSQELGWKEDKTRRILRNLKSTGCIQIEVEKDIGKSGRKIYLKQGRLKLEQFSNLTNLHTQKSTPEVVYENPHPIYNDQDPSTNHNLTTFGSGIGEKEKGEINTSEVGELRTKDPTQPTTYNPDHVAYKFAKQLHDLIKDNGSFYSRIRRFFTTPESAKQTLQKWSKHFDLCLHQDKISPTDLEKVLIWCQENDFWKQNILSGEKFRKQYGKLKTQMDEECVEIDQISPDPKLTELAITFYREQISNPRFKPKGYQVKKFVDATERVIEFAQRYDIGKREVLRHLAKCLDTQYANRGDVIHPGHWCSDYTWDILMPQYVAQHVCLSEADGDMFE